MARCTHWSKWNRSQCRCKIYTSRDTRTDFLCNKIFSTASEVVLCIKWHTIKFKCTRAKYTCSFQSQQTRFHTLKSCQLNWRRRTTPAIISHNKHSAHDVCPHTIQTYAIHTNAIHTYVCIDDEITGRSWPLFRLHSSSAAGINYRQRRW